METLQILEKKVKKLLECMRVLRIENARLVESCDALMKKLSDHESFDNDQALKLSREKESAQAIVDDLIKSIDDILSCSERSDQGSSVQVVAQSYSEQTNQDGWRSWNQ